MVEVLQVLEGSPWLGAYLALGVLALVYGLHASDPARRRRHG